MNSSDCPEQFPPDAPIDNTSPDVPVGAGLDLADPNSPLAPIYLRISHLCAVALVILFVFYARLLPLTSGGGLWSSLALGRWTVENARIPAHDPLSEFSDADAPLPASGWLGQVLLYLTYRSGANLAGGGALSRLAGGVEMLQTAHALLTLGFCVLALAAYGRRSGSMALGCVGLLFLIPAVPVLLTHLGTSLFGLLCFLALLALLARDELSWGAVVLAPLVMVLWANLDVSFVIGLLLPALLLVGQLIESARSRRTLRLLVILVGSVLLVALLNPDGPALFARLRAWSLRPPLADLVFYQPLNFSEWRPIHVVFLVTLVALTLAAAFSGRAYTPSEMATLLGFCLLALWKQGSVGWWFLVVPWLLLPQLAALGERMSWGVASSAADLRKTFVGALLGAAVVLQVFPVTWVRGGKPRPLSETLAPSVPWLVAVHLLSDQGAGPLPPLAAQLKAGYPGGRFTGAILADVSDNDFFTFVLPPKAPVFLYGEVALFPERRWREFLAIRAARADWWELLDRHGVNLIVINPDQDPKLAEAIEDDPYWLTIRGKDRRRMPWIALIRKKPLKGVR